MLLNGKADNLPQVERGPYWYSRWMVSPPTVDILGVGSKRKPICSASVYPGPRLGNSPVPSIVQCLARKDGTDDFYQLKVNGIWNCSLPTLK